MWGPFTRPTFQVMLASGWWNKPLVLHLWIWSTLSINSRRKCRYGCLNAWLQQGDYNAWAHFTRLNNEIAVCENLCGRFSDIVSFAPLYLTPSSDNLSQSPPLHPFPPSLLLFQPEVQKILSQKESNYIALLYPCYATNWSNVFSCQPFVVQW